jgi:hypothetical protein
MATERQIAANRRNAARSTGPRTTAGKKSSSANAYRHGLTARQGLIASDAQDIEELAAKLVGDRQNRVALQWARTAAEAEVALLRIRRLRSVLIQEITHLASAPDASGNSVVEASLVERWVRRTKSRVSSTQPTITSSEQTGAAELAGTNSGNTQAVRRALAHLKLLSRYEQREWCRRERSLQLLRKPACSIQLMGIGARNEPNLV